MEKKAVRFIILALCMLSVPALACKYQSVVGPDGLTYCAGDLSPDGVLFVTPSVIETQIVLPNKIKGACRPGAIAQDDGKLWFCKNVPQWIEMQQDKKP